jgi:hypothetical protein
MLLGRWIPRRQLAVVGLLVVSFAVFGIKLGSESEHRKLTPRASWGVLVEDYHKRKDMQALRDRVRRFNLSDRAVILTGMGPELTLRNESLVPADYRDISPRLSDKGVWGASDICKLDGSDVYLVYMLSRDNVMTVIKEGYDVYAFDPGVTRQTIDVCHYDIDELGIERLDSRDPAAFTR